MAVSELFDIFLILFLLHLQSLRAGATPTSRLTRAMTAVPQFVLDYGIYGIFRDTVDVADQLKLHWYGFNHKILTIRQISERS